MIFCPDDSLGRVRQLHVRLPTRRIFKPVLQSADQHTCQTLGGSAHLSDSWRITTSKLSIINCQSKISEANYQLPVNY
jgi:hypothetical protein